ncbi:MAG: hypothetical protein GC154_18815 [bacterium]|nr:hypothetical protein [bacterium]
MFTFTNPWLLWAFPVLALPWIFRRRSEDRIQRVDFPLLRLLKEAEEKEWIDPLLQELLLLILRTLLLAMILLALAGPKWHAGASGGSWLGMMPLASALQKQVAVIDDSYSMGYAQGDNDWRLHARQAWEKLDAGLSGLALQTYRWDAETLDPARIYALAPMSRGEIETLFDAPFQRDGASTSALFGALSERLQGGERLIVITDGQRWPWADWLDGAGPDTPPPPCLVVTVGRGPAPNAWCQVDSLSSPPWGVAAWESLGGSVGMSQFAQPGQGSIAVFLKEAGAELYSENVRFTPGDSIISTPFSYTADMNELIQKTAGPVDAYHFTLTVEPEDGLPFDNSLPLTVPAAKTLRVALPQTLGAGLASLTVIRSALQPDGDAGEGPVQIVDAPLSPFVQPEADLAILAPDWITSWNAADASAAMEFVKQGGSLLLFTGGRPIQNGWDEMLGAAGWRWRDPAPDSSGSREPASVSADGLLGSALTQWPADSWNAWIGERPGTLQTAGARSLAACGSSMILGESRLGKGRIWVVNASLSSDSAALLSPLLPVMLWEIGKETLRAGWDEEWTAPDPRRESDLTLLSPDDRARLTERYGVEFTTLEDMSSALARFHGGVDVRLALLFVCLALGLAEAWLANRLASM